MTLITLLMSVLVLLTGCVLAITPRLMPPTECFAVTVPPSAQQDPRIKGFQRSYALIVGGITVICAVGLYLLLPRFMGNGPLSDQAATAGSAVITVATLTPIVVGFPLMLFYRARVQELKQTEGWATTAQHAAALVNEKVPEPISLAWNLLHLLLTLLLMIFALTMYDRFPDRIPMNTDFAVTTYADKSIGVVLFPAIMVGYMGLIFTGCHWFTIISKHPVDPEAPVTSAYAYGRFSRMMSLFLLVGGLSLSLAIAGTFYATALGYIALTTSSVVIMVVAALFVAAAIFVSVKFGQSGARLATELRPNDSVARDDDAHWYLGTFYFNRDDPSIVVPKRFGFGWTINHARPVAWALIATLILVTVLVGLLVEGIM